MTQAITAFFRTRAEGEAAQNALLENGFPRHEVSFLASSSDPTELPKIGPIESTGAESEAAADAFIGSLVGLAAGTAASIVPGMGPLFAAGPFAAAIGGAALGGAFGGLIGLLRDHGVSEQEAEFYAKGVAKGGSLVTVHDVNPRQAQKAQEILEKCGAIKVEDLVEEPEPAHRAG
jgi:hypothetical protein